MGIGSVSPLQLYHHPTQQTLVLVAIHYKGRESDDDLQNFWPILKYELPELFEGWVFTSLQLSTFKNIFHVLDRGKLTEFLELFVSQFTTLQHLL
jgi:hypothetical protein